MLREFNLTPAELTDAPPGPGVGPVYSILSATVQIIPVRWPSRTRSAPNPARCKKALQDRGVKVTMITGDAQQVAHAAGQTWD